MRSRHVRSQSQTQKKPEFRRLQRLMRFIDRFVTPRAAFDSGGSQADRLRVRSSSAFLLFMFSFSMVMLVANIVAFAQGEERLRQAAMYAFAVLIVSIYRALVRNSSSEVYCGTAVNLFLGILYMYPTCLFFVMIECQCPAFFQRLWVTWPFKWLFWQTCSSRASPWTLGLLYCFLFTLAGSYFFFLVLSRWFCAMQIATAFLSNSKTSFLSFPLNLWVIAIFLQPGLKIASLLKVIFIFWCFCFAISRLVLVELVFSGGTVFETCHQCPFTNENLCWSTSKLCR